MANQDQPPQTDTPVTLEFSSDSEFAARDPGTVVKLNGQDITRYCSQVKVISTVHHCTEAHIEVLLRDGFRLQLPVSAHLMVTVMPGYRLIEEQTETGKQWTAEPVVVF